MESPLALQVVLVKPTFGEREQPPLGRPPWVGRVALRLDQAGENGSWRVRVAAWIPKPPRDGPPTSAGGKESCRFALLDTFFPRGPLQRAHSPLATIMASVLIHLPVLQRRARRPRGFERNLAPNKLAVRQAIRAGSLSSVDFTEELDAPPMSRTGRYTSFGAMLPAGGHPGAEPGTFPLAVGGHRGNGANTWTADGPREASFRHRENTVSSMQAAVEAGASFLEFDVQVTRDGQVVIFHDNFVVVGDESNPTSHLVADMDLAQFKGASPVNSVSVMGGSSNLELEGASDDEVASVFRPELLQEQPQPMLSFRGGDPLVAGSSPDLSSNLDPQQMPPPKLLRQHHNGVVASSSDQSLRAWTVEEGNGDEFPTLVEAWSRLPDTVVGIDPSTAARPCASMSLTRATRFARSPGVRH